LRKELALSKQKKKKTREERKKNTSGDPHRQGGEKMDPTKNEQENIPPTRQKPQNAIKRGESENFQGGKSFPADRGKKAPGRNRRRGKKKKYGPNGPRGIIFIRERKELSTKKTF